LPVLLNAEIDEIGASCGLVGSVGYVGFGDTLPTIFAGSSADRTEASNGKPPVFFVRAAIVSVSKALRRS
jgi:hypothetical protein